MSGQNLGNSTVTKADLVERVYQKIGFSKKEASNDSSSSSLTEWGQQLSLLLNRAPTIRGSISLLTTSSKRVTGLENSWKAEPARITLYPSTLLGALLVHPFRFGHG